MSVPQRTVAERVFWAVTIATIFAATCLPGWIDSGAGSVKRDAVADRWDKTDPEPQPEIPRVTGSERGATADAVARVDVR